MATAALHKRPVIVSITCVICFIILVGSFMLVPSPFIRSIGTWYPGIYGTIILTKFAACVGVWFMKKWGPITFLCAFIFSEILYTSLDQVGYVELAFYAIASIVFLSFYKRMDGNL